jgi:hypothetical protein
MRDYTLLLPKQQADSSMNRLAITLSAQQPVSHVRPASLSHVSGMVAKSPSITK